MSANVKPKTNAIAWIKRYWLLLILLALIVWVLLPTTNKLAWDEEVQLQDGQVITIKRTEWFDPTRGASFADVHNSPGIPIKARIKFQWNHQEVTWEEKVTPIILQVDRGNFVIVSTFYNCDDYRIYGKPIPPYLIQKYEGQQWMQIHISDLQIPEQSNLLVNIYEKGRRMTLQNKLKVENYGIFESVLRIQRDYRMGC